MIAIDSEGFREKIKGATIEKPWGQGINFCLSSAVLMEVEKIAEKRLFCRGEIVERLPINKGRLSKFWMTITLLKYDS